MLELKFRQQIGQLQLDIDCQFTSGITGIVGTSGAGKTSLLHAIAGLSKPDTGSITLNGETLFDAENQLMVPAYKRRIAIVFQDHRLFPHYTVRQNLLYGQKQHASKSPQFELNDIASMLNISHLLQRKIQGLSGGERQRVVLGRAILCAPRLLLLDEPFTGLDQNLKRQILDDIHVIQQQTKIPMLLVSHDWNEVLVLTQNIARLDQGRICAIDRTVIYLREQHSTAYGFPAGNRRAHCRYSSPAI